MEAINMRMITKNEFEKFTNDNYACVKNLFHVNNTENAQLNSIQLISSQGNIFITFLNKNEIKIQCTGIFKKVSSVTIYSLENTTNGFQDIFILCFDSENNNALPDEKFALYFSNTYHDNEFIDGSLIFLNTFQKKNSMYFALLSAINIKNGSDITNIILGDITIFQKIMGLIMSTSICDTANLTINYIKKAQYLNLPLTLYPSKKEG